MLLMRSGQGAFKDYTAEDISDLFNIPLEKIKKQPEFVINDDLKTKKPGQSSEISIPAGRRFPANIFFKFEGKSYELRYAEAINQIEKNDKIIEEYEPRKLDFKGAGQLIKDDNDDLIVYMFLYTDCKQSPFRGDKPYYYAFKDVEASSTESMAETAQLIEALTTIQKYSGDALRVVAKSFGITGTDNMADVTVQSMLVDVAKNPHFGGPTAFNKTVNSSAHLFKGIIQNAIDSGLFVIKNSGTGKIWAWGKTDSKGKKVVEIHDNGSPASEALINHILDDVEHYYPILTNISKNLKAESKAEKFFRKQVVDLASMFSNEEEEEIPFNTEIDTETQIGGSSSEQSVVDDLPNQTIPPAVIPVVKDKPADPKPAAKKEVETKPADSKKSDDDLPDFLKGAVDNTKK